MADDAFMQEVRDKYERACEAHSDNSDAYKDDIEFALLGKQWPEAIEKARDEDNSPCLVLNHTKSFIRQVVNEARANRPSIRVIPADGNADKDTAEIISGLIRNIEASSDADIAYDTAVESAVSGGFGYFRINTAYTSDDTFDQDIVIERIADAVCVIPDPDADSADGSDWNCCFITKRLTKDEFEDQYGDSEKADFDAIKDLGEPWHDDDGVLVAEYWKREPSERQVVALSDGSVVDVSRLPEMEEEMQLAGIQPVGQPRTVKSHKVTQYVLSGAEVLDTVEWPGKYIPIIPVYGDEVCLDGKRTFKSLIRDAKDAQREHNYWRSKAAETIALAPMVPFVGEEGAFDVDPEGWSEVNDKKIPYLEYKKGAPPPQRQPYAGPSYGEIQQATAAIDDMKSIIGIYDAKLGERSNETSGVAIRQRQRQGDIATYHFMDNLVRAIRQAGRILIDLIPKVYGTERVLRILGEDFEPQTVRIDPNAPPMEQQKAQMAQQRAMMEAQQAFAEHVGDIQAIYNLTNGKYDLVVKAGPAYGTQRELVREELVETMRTLGPQFAARAYPLYLDNSDWPGADKLADEFRAMNQLPDPKQFQKMQADFGKMQQQMAQLAQENRELKAEQAVKMRELTIDEFRAQTERMEAAAKAQTDQVEANADIISATARARQPQQPFTVNGLG